MQAAGPCISLLSMVICRFTLLFPILLQATTRKKHIKKLSSLMSRDSRVVSLLVDAGADVEACDYTGSRPLHLAAMRGHEEVARFLLWKGAHVNALERPGSASN